jgi:hypothetical protein
MAEKDTYGSPGAFRRALTDKLATEAEKSRWPLSQLQRQMAYDRLLERLYRVHGGWIVKGAAALLARDLGVRATVDIDIYRNVTLELAEAEVRAAAALDIDDWFRFEAGPAQVPSGRAVGARLPVAAYVGATPWAQFHVDIAGPDLRMTGEPDDVPPLVPIVLPPIEQRGYRAYPLVDHVADKVAATFDRYGRTQAPSTRYRDLIDLVAIVRGSSVDAQPQMRALASEADRRGIALPSRFDAPDRALWEPGYAAEAGRTVLRTARTLDEALAIVAPVLDPLLDGSAAGRWDPGNQQWLRP